MPEVFGVEIPDLEPELGTPVDVLVIVKCLRHENDTSEGNGTYRLVIRSSDIPTWEVHGMAAWVQRIAFETDLYEYEDEEEEDAN